MNEKIMGLIELAMKFKGKQTANVEFIGSVGGIEIYVFDGDSKIVYSKICYIEQDNAGEELDNIKKDLEEMLNKAA